MTALVLSLFAAILNIEMRGRAMTETEFNLSIDCRFPYQDRNTAIALARQACSISSNCVFMVAYECLLPPRSAIVSKDIVNEVIDELETLFDDPLKEIMFKIIRAKLDSHTVDKQWAIQALNIISSEDVGKYFCATTIILLCFDESDEIYEMTEKVRSSTGS
jgi:hypothetical protein